MLAVAVHASSLLAQLESLLPSWDSSSPAGGGGVHFLGMSGFFGPVGLSLSVLDRGRRFSFRQMWGCSLWFADRQEEEEEEEEEDGVLGHLGGVQGLEESRQSAFDSTHLRGGGTQGLSLGLWAKAKVFEILGGGMCVRVCMRGGGVAKADRALGGVSCAH